MPRAQSPFEASQFVDDLDCDISDESSEILDLALNIRRKFGVVVRQARQWKGELRTKQDEIVDLNTRHQQELSRLRRHADTIRDKLRRRNNSLQQYRKDNRLLRLRNQELSKDLEAMRKKLEGVSHMFCNICFESAKNVVTVCGHGFCEECLSLWPPKDDDAPSEREKTCPDCRGIIQEGDIWKIYLEPDSVPPAAPGGDDKATEILSLTSDSD